MLGREALRCIDRAKNLAQIGSVAIEIERDLVAVAEQTVAADGEPMTVDLKAVTESRLHDSSALADLGNQPMDIGNLIIVKTSKMRSDDRTEQQATEAGRRIYRKHHVAESNTARWHGGPGVENFQFGEEHGQL